jgi:hypothetical protein
VATGLLIHFARHIADGPPGCGCSDRCTTQPGWPLFRGPLWPAGAGCGAGADGFPARDSACVLIVLATSPRVAPGLLSWPAWQALRSADTVLAPAGHPQLPALDEAGIAYRVAGELPPGPDGVVVWLPEPGDDPPVPPGARLIRGSADLPGAHFIDLVATMDRLRAECPRDARQTHASLAPHLPEDSYEAVEALELRAAELRLL